MIGLHGQAAGRPAAQTAHLKNRHALKATAKRLAAPLYGDMITSSAAQKVLLEATV